MNKPKPDVGLIDTRELGMALSFWRPGKHPMSAVPHRKMWKVEFDTGIVIYIPDAVFGSFNFHLAEKDP